MVDLSIVILVWKDAEHLPGCLGAIGRARGGMELEIVLVQNGVAFEVNELEKDGIPLRVIRNEVNRGVAPARNQGMRAAQGRYVMLLDVDTRVGEDALVNLVRFMDEHGEVGLAGPRLEDGEGNLQLTCRKLPTVWSKALRRVPARWAQAQLADEMLAAYDHRTPRVVDYVIGACQIVRREAMEQVGLLDAEFFYGPEDVDYCLRMWRGGWRVMYVPEAVVVHEEQRLTKSRMVSRLSLIHGYGLTRYFWKWRYVVRRPVVIIDN
jgi:GT2 family glycosyltransferase